MSKRPTAAEAVLVAEWEASGELVAVLECQPCGRRRTVLAELRRRDDGAVFGRVEHPLPLDREEKNRRRAAGVPLVPVLVVDELPAAELVTAWCRKCGAVRIVPPLDEAELAASSAGAPLVIACPPPASP